ncbi:MAG: aminopeptidase [Bacteroidales bacterium]|nr:aminopeptidase [Bacteroidales bacterium]
MKKQWMLWAMAALIAVPGLGNAQKKKTDDKKGAYVFTVKKEAPVTPVKDQYRSGTCWSFSAVSFLESELLRMGKGEFDLSDMYPVYICYVKKGDKYVRMHGDAYFPTGGASNDVVDVLETHGIVPEEVFAGLNYGTDKHDHSELDRVLKGYLEAVVGGKTLTPAWRKAYNGILEAYFGENPVEFEYNGKTYTPRSFADELGLKASDYVKLTSFTHYPFYTYYEMDVPDNWNHGMVFNLPLDEFEAVVDSAIMKGYTLVWGGDVSERGFSWKNGVAIVPDEESEDIKGTDRDKWESMSDKEKKDAAYKFEKIVPEKTIDQAERQKGYDEWTSTDDHGMHLVGIAYDQNGNKYYKIKNSWNTSNPQKGYIYMSEAFFRAKTLDIMVNKEALPESVKAKMAE